MAEESSQRRRITEMILCATPVSAMLDKVRIEDIVMVEVVRSLMFCYSDHHESTERTVLYMFVDGLMNDYTRSTANFHAYVQDVLGSGLCFYAVVSYSNNLSHHEAIH